MRYKEPSVEVIKTKGLEKIELIGKVCTRLEHTIKPDTAPTFVYNRIKDGHTAILEHEYVYFDVSHLHHKLVDEFCKLSPYIRRSYDNRYLGFSYRFFIDVIGNSRRMQVRMNTIDDVENVNDVFYMMLLLTPEISKLLYTAEDIVQNIHNYTYYAVSVGRVNESTILKNAPEILNITFRIGCDRGITHELVRHKEHSYMQESTRYVNYSKERAGKTICVVDPGFENFDCSNEWADAMAEAEAHYMMLLEYGASAQMARSVLPHSTHAYIYMSGTLDMWIGEAVEINTPKLKTIEAKGFLPLRNSKFAHPQMIPIAQSINRILNTEYANAVEKIINYGK